MVEPPSPIKRREAVLPAEPREPLPFEGLEERTPLISNFAIDMEVETPDGQTHAVPPVEIKNVFATQHTLQIPPNASSITIEFPLRMLNKKQQPKKPKLETEEAAIDPTLADADDPMPDGATNGVAGGSGVEEGQKVAVNGVEADANGKTAVKPEKDGSSLTWPWQPELWFNGKPTLGSWIAADAVIDPALLEDEASAGKESEEDKSNGAAEFTTSIGYSYCKVRLLPKRGINVFEVCVRPEPSYSEISQVPTERYSIYFC